MDPQHYPALKAELLESAYDAHRTAGHSGDLAAQLNDRTAGLTRRRTVPQRDLFACLDVAFLGDGRSVWRALKETAANPAHPAYQAAWSAVEMRVNGVGYELDLDLPPVQMLLGGLQLAGILTADIAAAVDALADVPCSRAEQLFGAGAWISPHDVEAALALPNEGA